MTRPDGGFWASPDYEFVRLLGRGGTGWVALARHLPLDRLVAVKTMFGGQLDAAAAARVRREGRVLAALDRPTIVTVYQLVAGPDQLSLVMEYLPGGDLAQALGRDLPFPERVAVLDHVADALTAAAAAGIVHRDVKPGNVLLEDPFGRGRAVLADFGLARLPGVATEFRTAVGTVTGTPLYMAPEQFEHPELESPAIDAYAFGVMTYFVLAGRHPFTGATVRELFLAHRDQVPVLLSELAPGVPRRVAEAVQGALAKDPRRRLAPDVLAAVLRGVSTEEWEAVSTRVVGGSPAGQVGAAETRADPVELGGTHADAEEPAGSRAAVEGLSVAATRADGGGLGATGADPTGLSVTATGADPGGLSVTATGVDLGITATGADDGVLRVTATRSDANRSETLPAHDLPRPAPTGGVSPSDLNPGGPGQPSLDESWVEPPVYEVPAGPRRARWPGVLIGIAFGILVGLLVYFLLLRG